MRSRKRAGQTARRGVADQAVLTKPYRATARGLGLRPSHLGGVYWSAGRGSHHGCQGFDSPPVHRLTHPERTGYVLIILAIDLSDFKGLVALSHYHTICRCETLPHSTRARRTNDLSQAAERFGVGMPFGVQPWRLRALLKRGYDATHAVDHLSGLSSLERPSARSTS